MNQQEIDEIFDMKAENKPQKSFSPKTKKLFTYGLCAVLGIAIAVVGIILFNALYDSNGADSPEDAVAESQKADLLYDVDGMIKYSSEYNKIKKGGRGMTDDELRDHLNKLYSNTESTYLEENIKFEVEYIREYSQGDGKYDIIMDIYTELVPDAEIDKVAIVHMTVHNGVIRNPKPKDYVAVKYGGRWYYAFGYVE